MFGFESRKSVQFLGLAVGMTAYSLLSGRLALNIGRNTGMAETIKAIFEQPTIPLRKQAPHLGEAVCEIIDRALVKDPAQRWQSAAAMRNALGHVQKVQK